MAETHRIICLLLPDHKAAKQSILSSVNIPALVFFLLCDGRRTRHARPMGPWQCRPLPSQLWNIFPENAASLTASAVRHLVPSELAPPSGSLNPLAAHSPRCILPPPGRAMAGAVQTSAPYAIFEGACANEATARAFEAKCGTDFIAGCVADEDNFDECMYAFEACGTSGLEGKVCCLAHSFVPVGAWLTALEECFPRNPGPGPVMSPFPDPIPIPLPNAIA
ncbi:hypothetical protein GGX14DRAFT_571987 [Mycena pura]|uniref:Uncharacterized protein n=1 Tax=Mycena pura TaxID=153505 RepID=A0AAD6Y4A0_9AGAR|nr:hypothetical protein GGX14DRAFT_571987 [Mycena pura]